VKTQTHANHNHLMHMQPACTISVGSNEKNKQTNGLRIWIFYVI